MKKKAKKTSAKLKVKSISQQLAENSHYLTYPKNENK